MANEKQDIVFAGTLEAGTYTLTFDGDTTSAIAWDDDAAAVQADLEALASIGSGGVSVTDITGGFRVEFVGSLANTNVATITASSSLKRKADTIDVTVIDNGEPDTPVTPSNNIHTSAVTPVIHVEILHLGGATTGTFDLGGQSLDASTINASAVQTALDAIYGGGVVTAADLGGGDYSMTWNAAGAVTPPGVSNNSTDGNPYTSTQTTGVTGVAQVDHCTFDGTPDAGSMTFDGQSLSWNSNANTLSGLGGICEGTPASGLITTTWPDFDSHMPKTVSGDTLQATGTAPQFEIDLSDDPTEGSWTVTIDGDTSDEIAYNANALAVETAVESGTGLAVTVDGTEPTWTITGDNRETWTTITASEVDPLRKSAAITVTVFQEGSASSVNVTVTCYLSTAGVNSPASESSAGALVSASSGLAGGNAGSPDVSAGAQVLASSGLAGSTAGPSDSSGSAIISASSGLAGVMGQSAQLSASASITATFAQVGNVASPTTLVAGATVTAAFSHAGSYGFRTTVSAVPAIIVPLVSLTLRGSRTPALSLRGGKSPALTLRGE